MSEPEQCIICLEPLPGPLSLGLDAEGEPVPATAITTITTTTTTTTTSTTTSNTTTSEAVDDDSGYLNIVAALDGCDHIIHDACIRSWAQKTNTCPICRNPFHTVRVYNGLDGTAISKYEVQDKKQVAEFDVQQWLGENPEEDEEPSNPCPICNSAEREDVLLLCDSCDAAYHTHCVGLEEIPSGDWYCMECSHLFQLTEQPPRSSDVTERSSRPSHVRRPNPRNARGYHVRTRERLRRARRQARNAEWQGAWGQLSGRIYEMSELDLDNHDEEDEDLEQYRRFQELGRRELERWQQRMAIAHRLGAHDVFANTIPPAISERLQPAPEPVQETRDERRAWGALELAREADEPHTNSRKRKVRSVSASPREAPPPQEPERKLKRPRTRRLATQNGEGSSSMSSPAPTAAGPSTARPVAGSPSTGGPHGQLNGSEPPLVSSLLKELEPSATSEDETSLPVNGRRSAPEASSPALSPSPSAYSSPRALSITPPPLPSVGGRPTSPTLSLSTHIQPRYPPANYSPTRNGSHSPTRRNGNSPTRATNDHHSHSDSESRPTKSETRPLELRQPRPRWPHQLPPAPSNDEKSPTRLTMTQEEKRSINDIVKTALRPHWHAQKLTQEQYATINRDISRKLYDEVKNASSLNGEARRAWEQRATKEVAQAVAGLQA